MEYSILPATKEEAPFIAEAVIAAIGEDWAFHMAGSEDRVPLVYKVFTDLATREDSQYSYKNTLIAHAPDGSPAGAVVCYDGADLAPLRRAFIEEANRTFGWGIKEEDFTDETSPDEVYLDSLMVTPDHRRKGLGTLLIEEAHKRARSVGKPLGLLVDFDNPEAKRLYSGLGFKSVGVRPFAGKDMEHMQLL